MTPFSMFTNREAALQRDGTLSVSFYRFLDNLFKSAGGNGPTSSISPTGSPFTYTAAQAGQVIVNSGTVSKIELSRDGTNFFTLGVTQGMFLLKPQDELRVSYSGAPTMTFVPA